MRNKSSGENLSTALNSSFDLCSICLTHAYPAISFELSREFIPSPNYLLILRAFLSSHHCFTSCRVGWMANPNKFMFTLLLRYLV